MGGWICHTPNYTQLYTRSVSVVRHLLDYLEIIAHQAQAKKENEWILWIKSRNKKKKGRLNENEILSGIVHNFQSPLLLVEFKTAKLLETDDEFEDCAKHIFVVVKAENISAEDMAKISKYS